MGLIGLLIAAVLIILFFIFSSSSSSPTSITPKDAQKIQTGAQDAVNSAEQKSGIEQNQIKNIDLR